MDNKGNKQWVWLAIDVDTRELVGVYIGARDEAAAHKLWESLPPIQTFGQLIEPCYPAKDIEQLARKPAKLAILSGLTTL